MCYRCRYREHSTNQADARLSPRRPVEVASSALDEPHTLQLLPDRGLAPSEGESDLLYIDTAIVRAS